MSRHLGRGLRGGARRCQSLRRYFVKLSVSPSRVLNKGRLRLTIHHSQLPTHYTAPSTRQTICYTSPSARPPSPPPRFPERHLEESSSRLDRQPSYDLCCPRKTFWRGNATDAEREHLREESIVLLRCCRKEARYIRPELFSGA